MSVSHGFDGADRPVKRGRRRGNLPRSGVATGGGSAYFVIPRKDGTEETPFSVVRRKDGTEEHRSCYSRPLRKLLKFTGAKLSKIVPATAVFDAVHGRWTTLDASAKWYDVYRVSVVTPDDGNVLAARLSAAGLNVGEYHRDYESLRDLAKSALPFTDWCELDDLRIVLSREKELSDLNGPYWGAGQVAVQGSGGGETRFGSLRIVARKEAQKARELNRGFGLLVRAIWGEDFPCALSQIPDGQDPKQYCPPAPEWRWSGPQWRKLCTLDERFPRLYALAARQQARGEISRAAWAALRIWCRWQLDPPEAEERDDAIATDLRLLYSAADADNREAKENGRPARATDVISVLSRWVFTPGGKDFGPDEPRPPAPEQTPEECAMSAGFVASRERERGKEMLLLTGVPSGAPALVGPAPRTEPSAPDNPYALSFAKKAEEARELMSASRAVARDKRTRRLAHKRR